MGLKRSEAKRGKYTIKSRYYCWIT